MKKMTPLIAVESIEPCLPFWTSLGFETALTVPHEDTTGFAILVRDGLELMYQTRASLAADLEASGAPAGTSTELERSTSVLYVEVEQLEDVLPALEGVEVLVPRRRTFYGADEVFVRAPCGTVVGFAARAEEA
ncbi:MAG TPA: hypothetical protein VFQ22_05310 [Longimicrobiales bacterium]|nr:hypothetical protein [Longimicrobiales bacterium]